jgi:hypothetical protein
MQAIAMPNTNSGPTSAGRHGIGPKIVVDTGRKLLIAEIRRTTSVLRIDVYRMQPEDTSGDTGISADRFAIIRALVGRSGAVRIEQVGPALTEECDWALEAIKRYGIDCGWVRGEG